MIILYRYGNFISHVRQPIRKLIIVCRFQGNSEDEDEIEEINHSNDTPITETSLIDEVGMESTNENVLTQLTNFGMNDQNEHENKLDFTLSDLKNLTLNSENNDTISSLNPAEDLLTGETICASSACNDTSGESTDLLF